MLQYGGLLTSLLYTASVVHGHLQKQDRLCAEAANHCLLVRDLGCASGQGWWPELGAEAQCWFILEQKL